MGNSAWTETGTALTVGATTSTVDSSASSSPDYLANSDKLSLMADYTAELATKTSLDTTAASLSCSTTAYDAAVAAINTTLVNAGASATWATTWPDGTIFGPVVGIKTLLAQDWATVATTRTALQSAISAANAAAAQSAAVASAATDAATKMNAAIAQAQTDATTAQANAIAAANTAASTAQASAIATAAASAASDSIIPNGGFTTGDLTGWVTNDGGAISRTLSSSGLVAPTGGGVVTHSFQVTPGRKYKLIFWCYGASGNSGVYHRVFYGPTQYANLSDLISGSASGYTDLMAFGSVASSATYYSYDWTPASGVNYASLAVYSVFDSAITILGVFAVPYVQADYIDAGAVTAKALAADAVTANSIAADAVTATALAAGSVTTTALAAGSVTTTALAASAVTATNIEAGAVIASALTVVDTTNLCKNPTWADGLSSCWTYDLGPLGGVLSGYGKTGGTALEVNPYPASAYEIRNANLVPVAVGQTYYAEAWIALADVTSGAIYVRLTYYDVAGAEIVYADGNHITSSLATSGWHLSSVSAAAPSNAIKVRFSIIPDCLAGSYALVSDCFLRRLNDASLIVDGSISASKLVVGAAVADIETVGSLTAGVIYFTDGFCLNTLEPAESGANKTLSHIISSRSELSSTQSIAVASGSSSGYTSLPGLSFSVTSASTSDVFNLHANVNYLGISGASAAYLVLAVRVDGSAVISVQTTFGGASQGINLPLFDSITGLSAGAHTIDVAVNFINSSSSSQTLYIDTDAGTQALLQRIY